MRLLQHFFHLKRSKYITKSYRNMMTNKCDLLDEIVAIYGSVADSAACRVCALAEMCRTMLSDATELEIWDEFPEANALARRYIIKMYQALHEVKDDQIRGYEVLFKLHRLLLSQ